MRARIVKRSEPEPQEPAGTGVERRRWPRAALDWPVTIALADGAHAARLRDVSGAGLCFFLDRRVPEMTLLQVELELPGMRAAGAGHIRAAGVVVRCQAIAPALDHYEVAVFLNQISAADRRRLEDLVRSRLD
jgi:hypothetical protein